MVSSASWSKLVSPLKLISDKLGRLKFTGVLAGRPPVGPGVSVATTSALLSLSVSNLELIGSREIRPGLDRRHP